MSVRSCMKLISAAVVAVVCWAGTAVATDVQTLLDRLNALEGLEAVVNTAGDTVTLTGTKTDAEGMGGGWDPHIIPEGVTLMWQAEYSGEYLDEHGGYFLNFHGLGTLNVAEGGKIECSGRLNVVASNQDVTIIVSGGSIVASLIEGDSISGAAIDSYGTIIINSGTVTANGAAIASGGSLTVNGGTISANGFDGRAIYAFGSGATITINGGTIIAGGKRQWFTPVELAGSSAGTIDVSGGVIFGHGDAVVGSSGVIKLNAASTHSITGDGTVIAWNSDQGVTEYESGTSDDLLSNPANSAEWALLEDGRSGIAYTNGANIGFIEVDGVTVTGNTTAVKVIDREIPNNNSDVAVITPVTISAGEFIAGPNPVGRSSGGVSFYWNGRRINDAVLTVFDASGNVVNRVTISDVEAGFKPALTTATSIDSRVIGTWDLTDSRGRLASEGTYLVRGTVTTSDGKRERVSVLIGVR
ncbi:MAG: hypothetical protein LBU70_01605 [Chitinispirillales bacterium]|nr:hypothetical protein [Chitinispirillales bacterium]